MLDKEYSGTYLTRNPQLYIQGVKGLLFRKRVFWSWVLMAVIQSLLLTIIIIYCFENILLDKDVPIHTNLMITGMIVYGATILNTNVKIILFSNIFNPLSVFLIIASVLFFISNYAIESVLISTTDVYYSFKGFFKI